MPSELKPLPIGIQTFDKLIEGGYLYVDKTPLLYELVKNPSGVYFLSRPRRFGKSLTISTLEALFSNKRELFKGLWIDSSDYKWQDYPVIRLDMSLADKSSVKDLSKSLSFVLNRIAAEEGLELGIDLPSLALAELISQLHKKYKQQVVVLIDEYDKPILDTISKKDLAEEIREVFRNFYSVLKAQDKYLRFVFLTGVSKFSKVSIFSGLNNLEDISMDNRFAAICGYTQEELEFSFNKYIDLYAEFNSGYKFNSREELLETIKEWYNGYRFTNAETKVYNPFSTLLLFQNKEFQAYWFATGTPKFLLDIIESEKYYDLANFENLEIQVSSLSNFDINNYHVPSILFQAGYSTISGLSQDGLTLSYPNKEVRKAFLEQLLDRLSRIRPESNYSYLNKLSNALKSYEVNEFINILKSYFAEIPYDIHIPLEKYYQSMIYLICRMISERVIAEVRTNNGRIDMVIELSREIWIIEFKLNDSAENAIKQIREKKYYEKYSSQNKTIKLIGVNFSTEERNIQEWTECTT